jgi:drug/metabolite transporter (DMT)-like permease
VLASGDPFPNGHAALASVLAGCSGVVGLSSFYRALAIGTMSVVAPIGATGVALPLIVGLAGGDKPSAAQAAGLAVAVVGVLLASREPRADGGSTRMRGAGLAIVAALGFGGYFIGAHTGARGGVPWFLLLAHAVVIPAAVGLLVRGHLTPPAPREAVPLLVIGAFDLGATALYGVANRHGLLSIVSVVGSLYPLATLVLARQILRERLARSQGLGVSLALGGVALIAAG